MEVWNGAESPERVRSSKGRVMFLMMATHFSQCGDQKLFLAAFQTLSCGPMLCVDFHQPASPRPGSPTLEPAAVRSMSAD